MLTAAVAAGPLGRTASAATDQNFAAEVYSYSRSRGLFAGVALDGTSISVDRSANRGVLQEAWGRGVEIINGTVTTTDETARGFLTAVTSSTSGSTAVATAPPASNSAPVEATSSTPPANEAPAAGAHPPGETRTFPMADPTPGSEPK